MPLHQRRWNVSHDVAPSVYFGLDRKLCGIYTLEFADGERYVGQTVDLTSRLASHRRRWPDIVAVAFIECGREELDDLERSMITDSERGFVLRNKMLTMMPGGDAPIDLVVDRQQQAEWLTGVQPAYPLDERTRAAERRRRTRPKADQLAAHPAFPLALRDLTAYIDGVIPWPSVTGGLYWGVSAMPGTSRTAGMRRLYTVNAHNVELVYCFHSTAEDDTWVRVNTAPGIITARDRRGLEIDRHAHYRSYGKCDAITVDGGAVAELLERPSVLLAARTMALGLMRRGPSAFAKFHVDDLLDAVLVSREDPAQA